jgi:hypothetical protein
MARPRKARVEGATAEGGDPADPVPGDNGAALSRIVEFFIASFPDEWEAIRLCPLQHGLDAMVEKLKD